MADWDTQQFSTQSISAYRSLFRSLPSPDSDAVNGRYLATFIGPSWLTAVAPKLLPLGGLSGWAGKSFSAPNQAINLLHSGTQLKESIPMVRRSEASKIDSHRGLTLTYDKRAPLPLRALRDELRALDNNTLLGMTIADLPVLRHFPMPFLLRRL